MRFVLFLVTLCPSISFFIAESLQNPFFCYTPNGTPWTIEISTSSIKLLSTIYSILFLPLLTKISFPKRIVFVSYEKSKSFTDAWTLNWSPETFLTYIGYRCSGSEFICFLDGIQFFLVLPKLSTHSFYFSFEGELCGGRRENIIFLVLCISFGIIYGLL